MAAARFLRLLPSDSALLVCDLQEKFRNHIQYFPQIVEVTRRLIEAAKLLDMKIIATEQNPKGLGHTVAELELQRHQIPVFTKTKFSMCARSFVKNLVMASNL
ncbi:Isochorismatase domain-containing protein [Meloidogyne graminicola]|uniref:Isochorismatase domain-containing protein 1 n=1 Tax=Meloidogyne graminicola TaxID=189291 RepID=A0A8S9ZBR2_9BILA|nr:Isochorismatase domain-containing protein [Meloidogyne graminicola]